MTMGDIGVGWIYIASMVRYIVAMVNKLDIVYGCFWISRWPCLKNDAPQVSKCVFFNAKEV